MGEQRLVIYQGEDIQDVRGAKKALASIMAKCLYAIVEQGEDPGEPEEERPRLCTLLKGASDEFKDYLSLLKQDERNLSRFRDDPSKPVLYSTIDDCIKSFGSAYELASQAIEEKKYDSLRTIRDIALFSASAKIDSLCLSLIQEKKVGSLMMELIRLTCLRVRNGVRYDYVRSSQPHS